MFTTLCLRYRLALPIMICWWHDCWYHWHNAEYQHHLPTVMACSCLDNVTNQLWHHNGFLLWRYSITVRLIDSVSSVCLCMVHTIAHKHTGSMPVFGTHWTSCACVSGDCPLLYFHWTFSLKWFKHKIHLYYAQVYKLQCTMPRYTDDTPCLYIKNKFWAMGGEIDHNGYGSQHEGFWPSWREPTSQGVNLPIAQNELIILVLP